jgi:hypothetical protein
MMSRHALRRVTTAVIALVAMIAVSCGDDSSGGAASPPPSTTHSPSTSTSTTTSTTIAPTTTAPGAGVPAADLDEAKRVVTAFVDSLGKGDLDGAAATVGPISEQQAEAAGGLRSMLQQSTEGHGAWIGATDRTVTAIGIDHGLVVVVLEGTLQVEGSTEHRVAAFPVRRAESAKVWFVEPWAHEIAQTPPLLVRSPSVDPLDYAKAELDEPVDVRVETALVGSIWFSFDDGAPDEVTVEAGPRSTSRSASAKERVVILFESGPTLYATAFRLVDDDAAPPSSTAPIAVRPSPIVSVPFVDENTNQLLRSCAAGNDASCDAAQVPGVLDDGAFSFFHRRCNGGDRTYCVLLDHLVEAELRMHAEEGR